MKKLVVTAIIVTLCSINTFAQVGIGTTTPDASSVLDLTSTSKGFLPPRLTSEQRDAIASPVEGLTIYNSDTKCSQFWVGYGWYDVCKQSVQTATVSMNMGSGTSKVWLAHNLGADTSLNPHILVVGLQGAYIQWGRRGPSGDSRDTWQTAGNTANFAAAPTLADANAAAITNWSGGKAADGAWNSGTEAAPVKTTNDPCPTGFRVPTQTEWTAVYANNTATRTGTFSASSTNYGVALHYGDVSTPKKLTLPAAGNRDNIGTLLNRGTLGNYWSSSESGTINAYCLSFSSSNVNPATAYNRKAGFSLRCIEE